MSKLRVHELARELGRQNREVIEFLKSKGVDVRSHMSMVDEPAVSEVKNRFRKDNNNRGKEHIAKLETPKTEEKVVTAKSEGDKTETPKKKKNIIRVFHAQNASDGGKTRKKPVKAEGERTGSPRNAERFGFAFNSHTSAVRRIISRRVSIPSPVCADTGTKIVLPPQSSGISSYSESSCLHAQY